LGLLLKSFQVLVAPLSPFILGTMDKTHFALLILVAFFPCNCTRAWGEPVDRGPDSPWELSVFQADGKPVRLGNLATGKRLTVLLFLGADCPLSQKAVTEVTNDLAKAGFAETVGQLGLLVARDDAQDIERLRQEFKVTFPLYLDRRNMVAGKLGVKVVPTAVLLDEKGSVLYQGRINDRVEQLGKRSTVRRHDLREAVAEALQGKPVRVAKTEAVGCPVENRQATPEAKGTVEYHRDIQPILYKHCAVCHQAKGVAPFALANYEDATQWAEMAIDLMERKIMPPGQAESDFPVGDAPSTATPGEIDQLRKWVSEGMPQGTPPAKPVELPPVDPEGDSLGKPDLVLRPEGPMTLGATGDDLYRFMVFKLNLGKELNLRALRFVPGNRKVVHHTLVWYTDSAAQARISSDKDLKNAFMTPDDKGPGYGQAAMLAKYLKVDAKSARPQFEQIGGYAPGHGCWKAPPGYAITIPAKTDLVTQFHYHRSGKMEIDFSYIELYFSNGKIDSDQDFRTTNINDERFLLMPPNQRKRTHCSWPVQDDCRLVTIAPHGHLLTVSQTLTLERPDGTRQTLLHFPNYDFNWQRAYNFSSPVPLARGSKIHVSSLMDNTAANPNNPNKPPKAVFMGEGTGDEMVYPFLTITLPKKTTWNLQEGFASLYRTGTLSNALRAEFGTAQPGEKTDPVNPGEGKRP
jgi:hypothetical protein